MKYINILILTIYYGDLRSKGLCDKHDEIRQCAFHKNYSNRNYNYHIFTYSNYHRHFYNTLCEVRSGFSIVFFKKKN